MSMAPLWFGLAALLSSCAPPRAQSQRLEDGSWLLICRTEMQRCVSEIERVCNDRHHRVVSASEEVRKRDAPPFETTYYAARVNFVCGDGPVPAAIADSGAEIADVSIVNTPRVCAPGDTRVCVGPAACRGGQACRPDGLGFGPCDCGPVQATPSASAVPSTEQRDSGPLLSTGDR